MQSKKKKFMINNLDVIENIKTFKYYKEALIKFLNKNSLISIFI